MSVLNPQLDSIFRGARVGACALIVGLSGCFSGTITIPDDIADSIRRIVTVDTVGIFAARELSTKTPQRLRGMVGHRFHIGGEHACSEFSNNEPASYLVGYSGSIVSTTRLDGESSRGLYDAAASCRRHMLTIAELCPEYADPATARFVAYMASSPEPEPDDELIVMEFSLTKRAGPCCVIEVQCTSTSMTTARDLNSAS
jgi:hypothetical protein